MSDIDIRPHDSLPGHWHAGFVIIAGAANKDAALALLAEVNSAGDAEELPTPVTADMVRGERDRRTHDIFSYGGHAYDGDAGSIAAINRMADLALSKASYLDAETADWITEGIPSVWTDASDNDVPVLMDDMLAMRQAWIDREQALRKRCTELIASLDDPDNEPITDITSNDLWT